MPVDSLVAPVTPATNVSAATPQTFAMTLPETEANELRDPQGKPTDSTRT